MLSHHFWSHMTALEVSGLRLPKEERGERRQRRQGAFVQPNAERPCGKLTSGHSFESCKFFSTMIYDLQRSNVLHCALSYLYLELKNNFISKEKKMSKNNRSRFLQKQRCVPSRPRGQRSLFPPFRPTRSTRQFCVIDNVTQFKNRFHLNLREIEVFLNKIASKKCC